MDSSVRATLAELAYQADGILTVGMAIFAQNSTLTDSSYQAFNIITVRMMILAQNSTLAESRHMPPDRHNL